MGGFAVKNTIFERFVDLVAPHLCVGCDSKYKILCECCVDDIINEPFLGCWSCAAASASGYCNDHKTPEFDSFWIASLRSGVVKDLIDLYKFGGAKSCSDPLSRIIDARVPILPENTVVVPLPSKNSSIRQKGYDHTRLLASGVAERRGLKALNLLETQKNKTQHFMGKHSRSREIKGSFVLNRNFLDGGNIIASDAPILLVDDVVTTGATLLEAASVLGDGGFTTIYLAAIARQTLD